MTTALFGKIIVIVMVMNLGSLLILFLSALLVLAGGSCEHNRRGLWSSPDALRPFGSNPLPPAGKKPPLPAAPPRKTTMRKLISNAKNR